MEKTREFFLLLPKEFQGIEQESLLEFDSMAQAKKNDFRERMKTL